MLAKHLLMIMFVVSTPTWAANKCVSADGKVSFQDAPCASGQANMTPQRPTGERAQPAVMSADEVARSFEKQMESPEHIKRAERAVQRRDDKANSSRMIEAQIEKECGSAFAEMPSVGMTEQKFLNCTTFGRRWNHVRVNETMTQHGTSKQFVYPDGAPLRYVYTNSGLVTALARKGEK